MNTQLDTLVHTSTKSLLGNSYTDPNIFNIERRFLFRSLPVLAIPACYFDKKRNYTVVDIAHESVIVAKNKEDEYQAMANTCRHRGKRLLDKKDINSNERINLKSIVCPYHAWKYNLNGELVIARGDESSSLKGLCLKKLTVEEAGGLTFYHGKSRQIPQLKELNRVLGNFQLQNGKLNATKTYTVNANWKLWTENFLECWHCAPNHPELCEVKGFINQFEEGREDLYIHDDLNWRKQSELQGWTPPEEVDFQSEGGLFYFNVAMPLGKDKETATQSGKQIGPSLGGLNGMKGGAIFGCFGPFLFYVAYVDYIVLFTIRPKTVDETEVEVFWVTHKDYNGTKDELTWLWNTTLQQDIVLVEETQKGVQSLYYTPGPFQADEYRTQAFTGWWKQWYQQNKS